MENDLIQSLPLEKLTGIAVGIIGLLVTVFVFIVVLRRMDLKIIKHLIDKVKEK